MIMAAQITSKTAATVKADTARAIEALEAENVSDKQAAALLANDQKVIEAGVPLEFEEMVPHADGPHTYLSVKFPLRDAHQRVAVLRRLDGGSHVYLNLHGSGRHGAAVCVGISHWRGVPDGDTDGEPEHCR